MVIQVARLDRLKDWPTALRAVNLLLSEDLRAKFVVVGDGEERSRLERLTEELQMTERVLFLGSRSDVAHLLQAADAFMLSSISEGIPLTLIEAMATGLPCVATNVGGIPELIRDGETGLLVEAGDHVGLAAGLGRLASTPELASRLGMSGYRLALDRHDASVMHERYRELYREMACERADTRTSGASTP